MAVVAIHKVRRSASKRTVQKRDFRRTQSLNSLESFDVQDRTTPEDFEIAIREAIEHLLPAEKSAVLLRVQGHSVEEISEKLDRSRRSVERLLQSSGKKWLSYSSKNLEF